MSVGGIVSGIQTESIITQLLEIEQRPILLQQQKEAAFQVQLTAYGSMESLLNSLDTAAKKLDSATDLTSFTATSGDTDLFTAAADSTASPGNYDLKIYQLAQANKLTSGTFAKGEQVGARITIDATNNKIDFKEDIGGGVGVEKTATLTAGTYTFTELAAEIETQMNTANGTNVEYRVTYDNDNSKFVISDAGTGSNSLTEVQFLWKTGTNGSDNGDISAAEVLGFATSADDTGAATYTADYSIISGNTLTITAGSNDKINFEEDGGGELTATLTAGTYTFDTLAAEIKTQMDAAGGTYTVSYDYATKKFTITETGGVTDLDLLWNSGTNSSTSAATTLGFTASADNSGAATYTAGSVPSIGSGTISITVGTDTAVEVNVAATDTLQDIANNINESDANVTASVVDDGTWKYLRLTSGTTGEDYNIDITVTDADGNNTDAYGLSRLVYTTAAKNMTQIEAGQDAIIRLDGTTITRNTNIMTDVLSGVDITLDPNAAIDTLTIDSTNNKLDIHEDYDGTDTDQDIAATLTYGTYTYTELAAHIEAQLEAASVSDPGGTNDGLNYTVQFDYSTNKFKIKADGSAAQNLKDIDLDWSNGANAATSVGATLGFVTTADDINIAPNTFWSADNSKSVTSSAVLSITNSTSTLTSNINSFVSAYNNLMSFIDTNSSYDVDTEQGGILLGDSTTKFIKNKLRDIVGSNITGATNYNYLSDLGITLEEKENVDNQFELKVDSAKLAEALRDDYDDVVNFFTTSSTGFGVLTVAALDYILDPIDGILETRTDGINDSIDDIQEKVEGMERRLALVEERMRLQFAALEVLLSEFETTSNFLSQQIAGLQNMNTYIAGR